MNEIQKPFVQKKYPIKIYNFYCLYSNMLMKSWYSLAFTLNTFKIVEMNALDVRFGRRIFMQTS